MYINYETNGKFQAIF